MQESVRIVLEEGSQTAEARRAGRQMAESIGFDEVRAEQVAIVVTEACTNLLKHANGGEILLRTSCEDTGQLSTLEMMALDRGPGMNVEQCARDGYTTGSSHGHGIGAIMRLAPTADFYSLPEKGTAVLARWPGPDTQGRADAGRKPLEVGAVSVSKHGESVSGDDWGFEQANGHSVFIVADGLGHGPDAHTASAEAVRMFHLHSDLSPKSLIERIHLALRAGRGAAVAVVRIDRSNHKLTFSGVGNISAQIVSAGRTSQHLVSVNGTAGHQMHSLREFTYTWPDDGILVLNSDGLSTRTALEPYPRLHARDASLIAGVLYRDFSRGRDDATVVVAKAA